MFRIKNTLAVAIAALAASQAYATVPTLVGGGATLPAVAYVGSGWLLGNSRLSTTAPSTKKPVFINPHPADATSLFYVYTNGTAGNPVVSYCQTGSGTGRKVLEGVNSATGVCSDYTTSPTGFGAPIDAQFSASDAPLSGSDYNNFISHRSATSYTAGQQVTSAVVTNSAGDVTSETITTYPNGLNAKTQPVEFPSVAGAIAVVYNPPASVGTKKQIILTESQICRVFSGGVTTWGALVGTTDTTPITLVYRSDNSGTTFNFTNHLNTVCPSAVPTAVSGVFSTNSNFGPISNTGSANSTFANNLFNSTGTLIGTVPAVGESGNGAVVGYVATTSGSIGFAEVADAVSRVKTVSGGVLAFADVKLQPDVPKTYYCAITGSASAASTTKPKCTGGKTDVVVTIAAKKFAVLDPIKNLPTSVAVAVTPGAVLATDGVSVVASTASNSGVTSTVAHPECLNVVNPTTIAAPALTNGDYTQYPIMAVTYLLGYYAGNNVLTTSSSTSTSTTINADATPTTVTNVTVTATDVHANVASLLSSPYAIPAKVKTIGAKTGYAALSTTGWTAGTGLTTIAGCVNQ